jgi:hypothetical protein
MKGITQRTTRIAPLLLALLATYAIPPAAHGVYDPKHGRWMQRDPEGVFPNAGRSKVSPEHQAGDGANLHQFVNSRPTVRTDWNGLVTSCPRPTAGQIDFGALSLEMSPEYWTRGRMGALMGMGAASVSPALAPSACCPLVGIVQILRETYDGGTPGSWVVDDAGGPNAVAGLQSYTPWYHNAYNNYPPSTNTSNIIMEDGPFWDPVGRNYSNSFKHEFETCFVCGRSGWLSQYYVVRDSTRTPCVLGCFKWSYQYLSRNASAPPYHLVRLYLDGVSKTAIPNSPDQRPWITVPSPPPVSRPSDTFMRLLKSYK